MQAVIAGRIKERRLKMVQEIIPSTNIKLADIRDTLAANGGNVTNILGSFFADAAKINRWAKYKPVPINSATVKIFSDNITTTSLVGTGNVSVPGYFGECSKQNVTIEVWLEDVTLTVYTIFGLKVPSVFYVHSGSDTNYVNTFKSKLQTISVNLVDYPNINWKYEPGLSYYRLSDFVNYYPKAISPLTFTCGDNDGYYSLNSTSSLVVKMRIHTDSAYNLSLNDIAKAIVSTENVHVYLFCQDPVGNVSMLSNPQLSTSVDVITVTISSAKVGYYFFYPYIFCKNQWFFLPFEKGYYQVRTYKGSKPTEPVNGSDFAQLTIDKANVQVGTRTSSILLSQWASKYWKGVGDVAIGIPCTLNRSSSVTIRPSAVEVIYSNITLNGKPLQDTFTHTGVDKLYTYAGSGVFNGTTMGLDYTPGESKTMYFWLPNITLDLSNYGYDVTNGDIITCTVFLNYHVSGSGADWTEEYFNFKAQYKISYSGTEEFV